MLRRKNKLDLVINVFDNFLKTNFGGLIGSGRRSPAMGLVASNEKEDLNFREGLSGKLMRINHSGEVAAQGLYQGQLFFETDPSMRDYLERAAKEEADHLMWTEEYLAAKGAKKSYLNPIWYLGSFGLAVFMQLQGQKKSKSFLAETERQVQTHLEKHLHIFPNEDNEAQVILRKMYEDEGEHANWAENDSSGNEAREELSKFEKRVMGFMSKVMIETSRRI
ncbi:MAG: 2-polyprenyl-3-methyl-6-methoxy-1,4-benzoquinone monooxygenase [Burkholderiaceae bacterium]|nr:MAG: 2-polyprenyl-3-methyl-6-methoxy-1,4-benzoquinone monooxygenase [Burkholderiaceae bacterium]